MNRFCQVFKRYASTATKPVVSLDKIRNIGIIAHIDAGKTTTTERMLYYSGITKKIGNVDEGDTVTDYLSQERDRGITIQSAAVTIPWNNHRINIIDTPGHADFTFEVIRSLMVLDGVVTILDGVAGVEAQTEKVWRQATDLGIPKVVYVNKMDREGAGFSRTVKEVILKLNTKVVLASIPYFEQDPKTRQQIFKGVIDVFDSKLMKWQDSADGKSVEVSDITEDSPLYEEMSRCREQLVETLGELNEDVIDSFLETEDYMQVPTKVLKKLLHEATIKCQVCPILCGASFKNIGVQPLMDAVLEYLPSPLEINPPVVSTKITKRSKDKKSTKIEEVKLPSVIDPQNGCIINNNKNLTSALAFKVITDQNRGIMIFVRVYSGKLQSNSFVVNTTTGESIRIGKLLMMMADQPQEVQTLTSGSIGVITGANAEITTGDTLVASGGKSVGPMEKFAKLHPISVPQLVFSVSLEPKTVGDTRKMEESLQILLREDPSLKTHIDEESGQTVLTGMGELHLEIAVDRLVNDLKLKLEVGEVMVTYKENLVNPQADTYTKKVETLKGDYGITISIESFEEDVQGRIAEDDNVHYLTDNNAIVFEPNSDPEFIQEELSRGSWSLAVPYERIIKSITSGLLASLSIGGPIARLPLGSTIVRVHNYSVPSEIENVKELLSISRLSLLELIKSHDLEAFTFLEPITLIQVYVNDSDLGSVSQDLIGSRKLTILSIDDDLQDKDETWSRTEAQNFYLPHDITMSLLKSSQATKKVIKLEAPLKEMVGYLSKLRSLSKGTANYDMSYLGMRRVDKDRLNKILNA